jgi:hypothetical protein
MSARSTAAANVSILPFALLTAWVPAQWPVYLAEGRAVWIATERWFSIPGWCGSFWIRGAAE